MRIFSKISLIFTICLNSICFSSDQDFDKNKQDTKSPRTKKSVKIGGTSQPEAPTSVKDLWASEKIETLIAKAKKFQEPVLHTQEYLEIFARAYSEFNYDVPRILYPDELSGIYKLKAIEREQIYPESRQTKVKSAVELTKAAQLPVNQSPIIDLWVSRGEVIKKFPYRVRSVNTGTHYNRIKCLSQVLNLMDKEFSVIAHYKGAVAKGEKAQGEFSFQATEADYRTTFSYDLYRLPTRIVQYMQAQPLYEEKLFDFCMKDIGLNKLTKQDVINIFNKFIQDNPTNLLVHDLTKNNSSTQGANDNPADNVTIVVNFYEEKDEIQKRKDTIREGLIAAYSNSIGPSEESATRQRASKIVKSPRVKEAGTDVSDASESRASPTSERKHRSRSNSAAKPAAEADIDSTADPKVRGSSASKKDKHRSEKSKTRPRSKSDASQSPGKVVTKKDESPKVTQSSKRKSDKKASKKVSATDTVVAGVEANK